MPFTADVIDVLLLFKPAITFYFVCTIFRYATMMYFINNRQHKGGVRIAHATAKFIMGLLAFSSPNFTPFHPFHSVTEGSRDTVYRIRLKPFE